VSNYTTATLLADIRLGAMLPPSGSATFSDAELLRLADREMQAGLVPLIMRSREEFFVSQQDAAINASAQLNSVRIPARAIGGKLRDLGLVDDGGALHIVSQISIEELENAASGFYVIGNVIKLWSAAGSWQTPTLRMSYFRRPSRLVAASAVGVVATITTATKTVTITSNPGTISTTTPVDLVRASPGYESLGDDLVATVSGTSLVFAATLPTDLAVGDYVCLAGESPVPQVPPELHPVLAQRVIVKCLEAMNDPSGLSAAQAKLQELQSDAIALISPRVDGEPKRFRNSSSPFRRKNRSWLLY